MSYGAELGLLADRQLVIEAIVEDKPAKLELFAELAAVVEDDAAMLVSNTSSSPIVELGMAAGSRAPNVLGLHFFNPVPVLGLVEIIRSLLTSQISVERARSFAVDQLGKDAIDAADRAGFTVNALLIPYLLSATRMLEPGACDRGGHQQRDGEGVRASDGTPRAGRPHRAGHRPGGGGGAPSTASSSSHLRPCCSVWSRSGLLGRKGGRGFYSYRYQLDQ